MVMKVNNKKATLIIFIIIVCCIFSSIITLISYKYSTKTSINYYEENIDKVVEVASYDDENNKNYGTGWFYSDDTIITNYHVVSELINSSRELFNNIDIRFYDSEDYESVTLLKFNSELDIAILQYYGSHSHSYFRINENVYTSQKCYSIGNFSNYGLSYKEGYISLETVRLNYNDNYSNYIQCSINIGQGDSGAPVFNQKNEVIGMITFRTKNQNGVVEAGFAYAIPINVILNSFK